MRGATQYDRKGGGRGGSDVARERESDVEGRRCRCDREDGFSYITKMQGLGFRPNSNFSLTHYLTCHQGWCLH